MFNNTVNKQAFEFTCTSELIARRIQQEFEAHTIGQLTRMMDSVFAGVTKDTVLKIDQIEIDLGNIHVDEFGNNEMIDHFKNQLTEKIALAQHHKETGISTDEKETGSNEVINGTLELFRHILLFGDLPWWVDDSSVPDLDEILLQNLLTHPGELRKLMEECSATPTMLERLRTTLKPATLNRLVEAVPGLQEFEGVVFSTISDMISVPKLSPQQLKAFKLLRRQEFKSTRSARQDLVKKLMEVRRQLLSGKIAAPSLDIDALQTIIRHYRLDRLVNTDREKSRAKSSVTQKELSSLINRLSIFDVQFLLYELDTIIKSTSISKNAAFFPDEAVEPLIEAGTVSPVGNKGIKPLSKPEKEINIPEQAGPIIDNSSILPPYGSMQSAFVATPGIGPENDDPVDLFSDDSVIVKHLSNDIKSMGELSSRAGVNGLSASMKVIRGEPVSIPVKPLPPDPVDSPVLASILVDSDSAKLVHAASVGFIMRQLKTKSKTLQRYLENFEPIQLQQLKWLLSTWTDENIRHKKLVAGMMEHPKLLKLLQSFTSKLGGHSMAEQIQNNLWGTSGIDNNSPGLPYRFAHEDREALIQTLIRCSPRELLIVKDILHNQYFQTDAERSIVKKVLLKVPPGNLLLINYLLRLPDAESGGQITGLHEQVPGAVIKQATLGIQITEEKPGRNIYIGNAGLCLLCVYLPGFFRQLGYIEKNAFKHKAAALRAMSLLQLLITGNRKNAEYLLPLNKLLCGLQPADYLLKNIRFTRKEVNESELLLTSVIDNWKALKNTSIQGFREAFLQRKAILSEEESKWVLRVERKSYDILLNGLPWSFGIIKFPWMKKHVQVEW